MGTPQSRLFAKQLGLLNAIRANVPNSKELCELLEAIANRLQNTTQQIGASVPSVSGQFTLDLNGTALPCTEVNITDGKHLTWARSSCTITPNVNLDPSAGLHVVIIGGGWDQAVTGAATVRPYVVGAATGPDALIPVGGYVRNISTAIAAAMAQGSAVSVALFKNGVQVSQSFSIPPGSAAGLYQSFGDVLRLNPVDSWSLRYTTMNTTDPVFTSWCMLFAPDDNGSFMGVDGANIGVALSSTLLRAPLTSIAGTGDGAGSNAMIMPVGGTLQNLLVRTNGIQSATGALDITLQIGIPVGVADNLADSAVTTTVPLSGPVGAYVDFTHQAAFLAGQLICVKYVNHATATAASLQGTIFEITSGGTGIPASILGANLNTTAIPASGNKYSGPFNSTLQDDGNTDNKVGLYVPCDGTVTAFALWLSNNMASDGNTAHHLVATVLVNGIATGAVIDVAPGAASGGAYVISTNVAVLKGQRLGVYFKNNNTANAAGVWSWSVAFVCKS